MMENKNRKQFFRKKISKNLFSKLLISVFAIIALSFSFSACKEEYDLTNISMDSVQITTALEVPVATVHFTMEDLFKHRASKGEFRKLNEVYNLSNFLEDDDLPLPGYLQFYTNVEASDSLEDVSLKGNIGEGNVIDSICEAALTLTIENGFPFDGEVEVRFYEKVDVENEDGDYAYSVTTEFTSLTRSFYVRKAVLNDNNKVVSPGNSDVTVFYDAEDAKLLERVTMAKVFYKFNSKCKEELYIDLDYFIDIRLSAYLKARVAVVE